jgi:hypothetical protein
MSPFARLDALHTDVQLAQAALCLESERVMPVGATVFITLGTGRRLTPVTVVGRSNDGLHILVRASHWHAPMLLPLDRLAEPPLDGDIASAVPS